MTDDTRTQPDKFRDMAKELECDEDEAAFEGAAQRIALAPLDEAATLYWKHEGDDRYICARGPLWALPVTATQGHMGDVEDMIIVTESGRRFIGTEIRGVAALAHASGRKWPPPSLDEADLITRRKVATSPKPEADESNDR